MKACFFEAYFHKSKAPAERLLFCHTALPLLAIHKVLLRQGTLSGEKSSR